MTVRHFVAIAGALCLFAGLVFSFIGADKLHEALHSSAKPVVITASQLRSYRPGSSAHVTLTQFVPYEEGILVDSRPQGFGLGVWVPIIPADAPKGDRKEIVAVVQLSNVSDEASVDRALARSRWTGILRPPGNLPHADDIRRFNPGINLERCWLMWEGHQPESVADALPTVIVFPCLFVLGMVLAVVVALYPTTDSTEGSFPPAAYIMFVPYFAFTALGDAVRWLHRRGLLKGHAAILLSAVGFSLVATAAYVLNRDWDNVFRVTGEMYFAIFGGLFGLGLLANSVLLGIVHHRFAPASPDSATDRIAHDGKAPEPTDYRQIPVALSAISLGVLLHAGISLYQGDHSNRVFILAAFGSLVLTVSAVWYGFLRRRGMQEKAQFWNEPGR